jgi:hypothetical protein
MKFTWEMIMLIMVFALQINRCLQFDEEKKKFDFNASSSRTIFYDFHIKQRVQHSTSIFLLFVILYNKYDLLFISLKWNHLSHLLFLIIEY